MKKYCIVVFLVLLLFGVSCTSTSYLVGMESPGVKATRGKNNMTVLTAQDGEKTVISIGGDSVSNEAKFFVNIYNSGNDYKFYDERNFSLYSGDVNLKNWTKVGTWDASAYLTSEKTKAENAQALTAIAGFFSVIGSAATAGDRYHYETDVKYNPRSRDYTITERKVYDNDVFLTAFTAAAATESVSRNGKNKIKFLEDNLLFGSDINPGWSYSGWMFFDVSKAKGQDFMIRYNGDNGPVDFYFVKSESK